MRAVKEGKRSGDNIFLFLSRCLFLSKMQKSRERIINIHGCSQSSKIKPNTLSVKMQFNDNNIYNLFQKVEGLDKVEGMDEGFVGRTGQGLVTVRDE